MHSDLSPDLEPSTPTESRHTMVRNGSVHVLEVGFGQSFIFSARHQLDTWTLAPQKHVVWRDSVGVEGSRSGL